MKRRITECLDIDLEREVWCCNRCSADLISANENYKKGCLVYARNPETIHKPLIKRSEFDFSTSPDWCQIVEFYCPNCGTIIDNEYLPPGHPITHDIELDLKKLKAKYVKE